MQFATRSTKAPGARPHVLTIGVSDYGDKAMNLRLKFAHRDVQEVSALLNTQEGGLYAEVKPICLHDSTADKAGIFDALAAIERNMAGRARQDLAVVTFSGHGTMIDNQFYLVPYGADSSTPARLKASAIASKDPERNRASCPAWAGPGFARRLPFGWPNRRPVECAAGRRHAEEGDWLRGM